MLPERLGAQVQQAVVQVQHPALAVDENRKAFLPEPWEDVDEAGRAAGQRIEQVWFPGVHSDVGGGYEDDRRLADLSLSWMLGRLRDVARTIDPSLDEGVYVQNRGPHYETPAEVQMAKAIGGHIVGMSTALEAIAARQAGMEILGMSLITNLAAGISPEPLSHQEVIDAGRAAEPVISALLAKIVAAV